MTVRYVLGSIDEAYKPEPEYIYLAVAGQGERAVKAVMWKVREWDPRLHPRDHRGMFIDTPDKIKVGGSTRGDVVVTPTGQPFRVRGITDDGLVKTNAVDKDTGVVDDRTVLLPPDVEVAVFDPAPQIGERRKLKSLRAGVYVTMPNGDRYVVLEAMGDEGDERDEEGRMVLAPVDDRGEIISDEILTSEEERLKSEAGPGMLDTLKDGEGPVERRLRAGLDKIGLDPYDVDLDALDDHAESYEDEPRSRFEVAGKGLSPCAISRSTDFAVHVLLPEMLREKYPDLAKKLRDTSPRWGRRTGQKPLGLAAPRRRVVSPPPEMMDQEVVVSAAEVGILDPAVVLEAETVRYKHQTPVDRVQNELALLRSDLPDGFFDGPGIRKAWADSRSWVSIDRTSLARSVIALAEQVRENHDLDEYSQELVQARVFRLRMVLFADKYNRDRFERLIDEVAAAKLPSRSDAQALLISKGNKELLDIADEVDAELFEILDDLSPSSFPDELRELIDQQGRDGFLDVVRPMVIPASDYTRDPEAARGGLLSFEQKMTELGVVEPYSIRERSAALLGALRSGDLRLIYSTYDGKRDRRLEVVPQETMGYEPTPVDEAQGLLDRLAGLSDDDIDFFSGAIDSRLRGIEASLRADLSVVGDSDEYRVKLRQRFRTALEDEIMKAGRQGMDEATQDRLTGYIDSVVYAVAEFQEDVLDSLGSDDRFELRRLVGRPQHLTYVRSLIKAESARLEPDYEVIRVLSVLDDKLTTQIPDDSAVFTPEDIDAVIDEMANGFIPSDDELLERYPILADSVSRTTEKLIRIQRARRTIDSRGRPPTISQFRRQWIADNMSDLVEAGMVTTDGFLHPEIGYPGPLTLDGGQHVPWFRALTRELAAQLSDDDLEKMAAEDEFGLLRSDNQTIAFIQNILDTDEWDPELLDEIAAAVENAPGADPTIMAVKEVLSSEEWTADTLNDVLTVVSGVKIADEPDAPSRRWDFDGPIDSVERLATKFENDASAHGDAVDDWDFLITNGLTMNRMSDQVLDDLESAPKMYPAGVSSTTRIQIKRSLAEGPEVVDPTYSVFRLDGDQVVEQIGAGLSIDEAKVMAFDQPEHEEIFLEGETLRAANPDLFLPELRQFDPTELTAFDPDRAFEVLSDLGYTDVTIEEPQDAIPKMPADFLDQKLEAAINDVLRKHSVGTQIAVDSIDFDQFADDDPDVVRGWLANYGVDDDEVYYDLAEAKKVAREEAQKEWERRNRKRLRVFESGQQRVYVEVADDRVQSVAVAINGRVVEPLSDYKARLDGYVKSGQPIPEDLNPASNPNLEVRNSASRQMVYDMAVGRVNGVTREALDEHNKYRPEIVDAIRMADFPGVSIEAALAVIKERGKDAAKDDIYDRLVENDVSGDEAAVLSTAVVDYITETQVWFPVSSPLPDTNRLAIAAAERLGIPTASTTTLEGNAYGIGVPYIDMLDDDGKLSEDRLAAMVAVAAEPKLLIFLANGVPSGQSEVGVLESHFELELRSRVDVDRLEQLAKDTGGFGPRSIIEDLKRMSRDELLQFFEDNLAEDDPDPEFLVDALLLGARNNASIDPYSFPTLPVRVGGREVEVPLEEARWVRIGGTLYARSTLRESAERLYETRSGDLFIPRLHREEDVWVPVNAEYGVNPLTGKAGSSSRIYTTSDLRQFAADNPDVTTYIEAEPVTSGVESFDYLANMLEASLFGDEPGLEYIVEGQQNASVDGVNWLPIQKALDDANEAIYSLKEEEEELGVFLRTPLDGVVNEWRRQKFALSYLDARVESSAAGHFELEMTTALADGREVVYAPSSPTHDTRAEAESLRRGLEIPLYDEIELVPQTPEGIAETLESSIRQQSVPVFTTGGVLVDGVLNVDTDRTEGKVVADLDEVVQDRLVAAGAVRVENSQDLNEYFDYGGSGNIYAGHMLSITEAGSAESIRAFLDEIGVLESYIEEYGEVDTVLPEVLQERLDALTFDTSVLPRFSSAFGEENAYRRMEGINQRVTGIHNSLSRRGEADLWAGSVDTLLEQERSEFEEGQGVDGGALNSEFSLDYEPTETDRPQLVSSRKLKAGDTILSEDGELVKVVGVEHRNNDTRIQIEPPDGPPKILNLWNAVATNYSVGQAPTTYDLYGGTFQVLVAREGRSAPVPVTPRQMTAIDSTRRRVEYVEYDQVGDTNPDSDGLTTGAPTSQRGQLRLVGYSPEEALEKLEELGLIHGIEPEVPSSILPKAGVGRYLPLLPSVVRGEEELPTPVVPISHGVTGTSEAAAVERLNEVALAGGLMSIAERIRRGIQPKGEDSSSTTSPKGDVRSGIDTSVFALRGISSWGQIKIVFHDSVYLRRDLMLSDRDFGGSPSRYAAYSNYHNSLRQRIEEELANLFSPLSMAARDAHIEDRDSARNWDESDSGDSAEFNPQIEVPIEDWRAILVPNAEVAEEVRQILTDLMFEGAITEMPAVIVRDTDKNLEQLGYRPSISF